RLLLIATMTAERHFFRFGVTAQDHPFRWLPAIGQGKSAVHPISIQAMTAERQENYRRGPGIALVVLLAAVFVVIGPDLRGHVATTERIGVNRYSGLAIEGFDPVAYFTDDRPIRGLPDFEAAEGGAVWRFQNAGNRDAFAANPEIYGPQFGGYDPIDIARGVA